ncbi:flagellar hook-length control protein FliK [Tabrizicola sp. BL-A-41-H6]|uniref:flagellar hook-length control protein FliK n=1 Tax=Tabrizicola sp. BL-A-41-H6 TaxID=3421107 RepID=UPI003D67FD5F
MQAIPPILLASMPRAADVPGEGEACHDVSFGDEFDADAEGAGDATQTATDKVMGSDVVTAVARVPDFWMVRPQPALTASEPPSPALEAHFADPDVRSMEGAPLSPDLAQVGSAPPFEGQAPKAVSKVPFGAADLAVKDLPAPLAPARADDDASEVRRYPAADAPVAAMTSSLALPVAVGQTAAMLPQPDQGLLPLHAAAIWHAATAPAGENDRHAVAPSSLGNDTDGSLHISVAAVAPRAPQAVGPARAGTEDMASEDPAADEGPDPRLGSTAQPEGQGRLGPPVPPGEARFACVVTTAMLPADLTSVKVGPPTDELLDATGSVMSLHGSLQWPTLQPSAHVLQGALPTSPVAALAAQIVQSASLGESTTEIALSPDELGEVRLTFRPHETDASRIVVMMTFERPEAMDLFRRNADQLVADLKMAGFTGADLGFAHSNSGNGGSAGPDHPPSHAMPFAADAPVAHAPAAPRPGTTTSLDLRL